MGQGQRDFLAVWLTGFVRKSWAGFLFLVASSSSLALQDRRTYVPSETTMTKIKQAKPPALTQWVILKIHRLSTSLHVAGHSNSRTLSEIFADWQHLYRLKCLACV